MRTWARRVETLAEVPPAFQAAYPQPHEPIPYTIYLPEDKLSKAQARNAQLLCLFAEHLVVLEKQQEEIVSYACEFGDVFAMQRGLILLNSWLQIRAAAGLIRLPFNTAVETLFMPVIERIRQAAVRVAAYGDVNGLGAATKPDLSPFDFLDRVNYKFMNYGRASIRPHDTIHGVIYQPDVTLQTLRFLKRTVYRQYKTAHLAVLTDNELILIQEAKAVRTNFDATHGGVFTYIPRRQIMDVSFVERPSAPDAVCLMDVALPDKVHVTVEFAAAHPDLPQFQALFE